MANPVAPQIAILGAGIFVKTQYIPRLSEISNLVSLKAIWSRTEESARGAVEIAQKFFPGVVCKWGDKGLDEISQDSSILGVAVVLAGQAQVDFSLRMLKAGKHVLQATSQLEAAIAGYNSVCANISSKPIWAVAENYRFEPAFVECKKLVADIGDMMNVQVIIEGSMNSSNPYFSSSWRRDFTLVGSEVVSVSALTSYVDKTLPPPDNITSLFQLANGCSGVFVMIVSSSSPKIIWRVVGLKGTLQVERGKHDGQHGYLVTLYSTDGQSKSTFYKFSGVTDEFKSFIYDISQASIKGNDHKTEPRMSFEEGARDVAVLEAMLESGAKQGAPVQVKKF
ncbi:hypothetical protein F8388_013231 [Cannabis sativa]|uniref:Gfo/Idh/MocA-like oxidoreductase N-terminal domain-containing protein n=1 Tax=Cannabis sativa TaxID=3483 RepID=A0A7J6EDJ1_CANSA|nr:hypothetical protein F8388_013231 [Cannabis sativa]KAF4391727.1 hypothetical protein G4B88_005613 [Cannabis sativa]